MARPECPAVGFHTGITVGVHPHSYNYVARLPPTSSLLPSQLITLSKCLIDRTLVFPSPNLHSPPCKLDVSAQSTQFERLHDLYLCCSFTISGVKHLAEE